MITLLTVIRKNAQPCGTRRSRQTLFEQSRDIVPAACVVAGVMASTALVRGAAAVVLVGKRVAVPWERAVGRQAVQAQRVLVERDPAAEPSGLDDRAHQREEDSILFIMGRDAASLP
ncbi:hypothetical protein P3T37_000181 [Kitasatospora sp. MAA4]|uniref:hypothetical protein n=1 Tax=Kitasatospora sp. MAA4 TaxID=3035093 RepID=UPI002475A289|nr:hypothetical protein [Kitasatospora sp. MAA4]MDH6130814.1 hypothetical protein [Kitasatospora sp. MAA4]